MSQDMPDGLNLYCGYSGFLDVSGLVIGGLVDDLLSDSLARWWRG
jgi:hypothetical protein